MKNAADEKIKSMRKVGILRRNLTRVVLTLAIVVAVSVFWTLRIIGITLEYNTASPTDAAVSEQLVDEHESPLLGADMQINSDEYLQ